METEEERRIRRRKRIEEMKKEKRRVELLHRLGLLAAVVAAVLLGCGGGIAFALHGHEDGSQDIQNEEDSAGGIIAQGQSSYDLLSDLRSTSPESAAEEDPAALPEEPFIETSAPLGRTESPGEEKVLEAHTVPETADFDENVISQYGILIDVETGSILAQRAARERMNPASMTKILTVLVAAEHLTETDLEETVTITIDITDYSYVNGCSNTGYDLNEVVTVRDLFYGTILPSGADSALALAIYVAGSQEAFVELMNEKLEALGLAESTHFTNCVGLYDENHYSTAYDMAVILKAAVDNEFCREVLSAHTYTTSLTEQHPEGLLISNWFLRRIEDRDIHGEVLCGKTGYVDQSGSCAASFSRGNDGREYLCVTAGSSGAFKCIADQVELYQKYLPEL